MEIFLAFEPIKEAASDFIKLRVKTFNQFHEKQKNATEIIMFISGLIKLLVRIHDSLL